MRARAERVHRARRAPNPPPPPPLPWEGGGRSEEAELLRAVADQHVLGLLIMIEHHLVVFAADARLLVAAERRMCGIGVVAIGPNGATETTGPKISSWKTRILLWPLNTVGVM